MGLHSSYLRARVPREAIPKLPPEELRVKERETRTPRLNRIRPTVPNPQNSRVPLKEG